MRAVSLKRQKQNRDYKPIHDAVIERDGRCMAPINWGTCEGGWDVHHRKPRSRFPLDALDPNWLVTLCDLHHRWCHGHPLEAREAGLLYDAMHAEIASGREDPSEPASRLYDA